MVIKRIHRFVIFIFFVVLSACSKSQSIYQNLGSEEDGVISVEIHQDDAKPLAYEPRQAIDVLSATELDLVNDLHEGEVDQLSFVVIDVQSQKVIRSYHSHRLQRLASVTKLTTALAALENVRNVEVPKVRKMLKISNNGEASRYVRLAAKAIDGIVIDSPHYTQPHSCPSGFLEDQLAADSVFLWLKSQLPEVDWSGSDINDGAGCHYDNFMSAIQVSKILQYADLAGKAFAGLEFEDLLSINGKDGTWKNKNLDRKGYIFAKTGTLNPNANLSGYFYAKRGGKMVKHYFSVFINKKGGGTYSTNARKLIEGLLRYWINYYSSNPADPLTDF